MILYGRYIPDEQLRLFNINAKGIAVSDSIMIELDIRISKYFELIEPAKSAVYADCKECGQPFNHIMYSMLLRHVIKHEKNRLKRINKRESKDLLEMR